MRKGIYFISIFIMIFYSGCSKVTQVKTDTKYKTDKKNVMDEMDENIIFLVKQVKGLDTIDKQRIYRTIQNDIDRYNKEGNDAYEEEYNYEAIKAYELVNFYEGYSYIPKKKIKKIKKVAKAKSKKHYKQGVKYYKKNKKRSLAEFNIVMKNNPSYKDTRKKIAELNQNKSIKKYLKKLEKTLNKKVVRCQGSVAGLKRLKSNLRELLKYDYDNAVALKSNIVLKEYNTLLVKRAIGFYKDGRITKAKDRFTQILQIYKDDAKSLKYLKKIKVRKTMKLNLQTAQKLLKQKKYMSSIVYAKKVLKIESDNSKAKKVIIKAKKEAKIKVQQLVERGKELYSLKKLDQSKKIFREALKIDPRNSTARIYFKKIDRQLKTIKSLQ